ncbi:hypothetical protein DUI87_00843 [Hirundo rustica rustica]|uniref:Uncharacterized protein n=1 Tax=Hirundo rustica rustica TaxID=333673 RepID=A0A3M0LLI3_HIRRU|nr:hypothetical protein DUI87_00843 [Hirundo rustica rustica]
MFSGVASERMANSREHPYIICLTHSRPGKPFSTCLVGLPVSEWPIPENIPPAISKSIVNPVDRWDVWMKFLPVAPFEPQELEILGSVRIQFCVKFGLSGVAQNKTIDVTPNPNFYRNSSSWCNYTKMLDKPSNHVPAQLPRGIFFICGDRIWPAISTNVKGGPCSIGMLSLLTPNMTLLREQKYRGKRSIKPYDTNCDDNVHTWDKAQRIAVALFSPQAASGAALTQLDRVGCWLSKHARATSLALSDMLMDVDSVRRASLQNRAAIDYLLLTHGHGCEEFEGMCCMNLSDHSKSIHENIKQLQESVNKLGEGFAEGKKTLKTPEYRDKKLSHLDPGDMRGLDVHEAKGGHWLSPQRFLKYQAILVEQGDVEIVVPNIVNPASFLSRSMGKPVIHDCLETIEATYSSRPDLKDTPVEDAETWFTDGSSYVISGRHAGYAVTTSKEVIESGPLTSTWTQGMHSEWFMLMEPSGRKEDC